MIKKNILLIGFAPYSFLNFYEKFLNKHNRRFNFYIITDYIDNFYEKKFKILKKKKIIKNFFRLNACTLSEIHIDGFFQAKKISKEIEKINFYKIISSDCSKPEVEFIIKKVKKIAKVYAFNHHSYKYYNFQFNISYILKFKIRSVIRYLRFRFNQLVKYIFLSYIFFHRIPEKFFLREGFPLYSPYVDIYLTDKIHEYYFYKEKFPSIKIKRINRYTKKKVKNSNLLLLGTVIKNPNLEKSILSKTNKYLELAIRKFKINKIYYKPHPRDHNNLFKKLIKINPQLKINCIKKDENSEDSIKNFRYIFGYDSATLQDATNLFNRNIVIGFHDIACLLTKDPKPKILLGDFNKFKSGIIWINDLIEFQKFNKKQIIYVSKKLQIQRFNFFRDSNSFEKEFLRKFY